MAPSRPTACSALPRLPPPRCSGAHSSSTEGDTDHGSGSVCSNTSWADDSHGTSSPASGVHIEHAAMDVRDGDACAAATQVHAAEASGKPLGAVQDPDGRWLLPFGVTTYTHVLSNEQLEAVEEASDALLASSRQGRLPTSCFHVSASLKGTPKRTKFFFGARCVRECCCFVVLVLFFHGE